MISPTILNISTVLDWLHFFTLQDQVEQTVSDADQRSRVREQLLARDGLIRILEDYEDQHNLRFEISVHRGFAREHWRYEILGIVDVWINGRLVAAYPVDPGATHIWPSVAEVKAESAPDLWTVVALATQGEGIQAALLGWITPEEMLRRAEEDDKMYKVAIAALEPPESLFALLLNPPDPLRKATVKPKATTSGHIREMLSQIKLAGVKEPAGHKVLPDTLDIRPLSRIAPEVFDCLVADRELAEAYIAAIARTPQARARVRAPAEWELQPPTPSIKEWLRQIAKRTLKKRGDFWQEKIAGMPPLRLDLAGAATQLDTPVYVLDGSAPDRAVRLTLKPRLSLFHKADHSQLYLFTQIEPPVDSADLMVLDAAHIEYLNTLLGRDMEAGPLIQEIFQTQNPGAKEYIGNNVLVYPAEVRANTFVELTMPLTRSTHSLPNDVALVLIIHRGES